MMVPASWLCLAVVMAVTPGSHQWRGVEFLRLEQGAHLPSGSSSSWPERCGSAIALSHRSGFLCKPPIK